MGAPRDDDPVNPQAKAALPEVCRLVLAGQYTAAQKLANRKLMAIPLHQMPCESVGNLLLDLPPVACLIPGKFSPARWTTSLPCD